MFNGEILFDIADTNCIKVDFENNILPTKIINMGDVVAIGRKAPKNRWIYEIKYHGEKEYYESMEKMINQLCDNKDYVNELVKTYDEVNIKIYIRSKYAEIGHSIPNHLIKKLAELDCVVLFEILSFGMSINE